MSKPCTDCISYKSSSCRCAAAAKFHAQNYGVCHTSREAFTNPCPAIQESFLAHGPVHGSHGMSAGILLHDPKRTWANLTFMRLMLLWYTREVFPCMTPPGARMICPPKAWPMHWCPMQTPNTGMLGPRRSTICSEIPESSGRPVLSGKQFFRILLTGALILQGDGFPRATCDRCKEK